MKEARRNVRLVTRKEKECLEEKNRDRKRRRKRTGGGSKERIMELNQPESQGEDMEE